MDRLSRSFQLVLIFPDNYRLKQSWKFRRKIKLSDVLREEPYILIRTRRHSQCLGGIGDMSPHPRHLAPYGGTFGYAIAIS